MRAFTSVTTKTVSIMDRGVFNANVSTTFRLQGSGFDFIWLKREEMNPSGARISSASGYPGGRVSSAFSYSCFKCVSAQRSGVAVAILQSSDNTG